MITTYIHGEPVDQHREEDFLMQAWPTRPELLTSQQRERAADLDRQRRQNSVRYACDELFQ